MKAIIYIRTSTEDQIPEKQIEDCLEFAKQRGYEVIDIFKEKLSGYKQIERPLYDKIKVMAHEGKINAVIVWAMDRWVRNRDTLLEDIVMLKNANVKLHSVKDQWIEGINLEGAMGRTIQDLILGLIGSIAEMESDRKRERTIMAYKSYKKENRKYNKWGRRSLPDRAKEEVIELYTKGLSIRAIADSVFYYDKHSNRKQISIGAVHKIVSEVKEKIDRF